MVEGRDVDLGNREARFRTGEDKTRAKTGKARVIHLNDTALAMLSKLCAENPSGKLFRNSRGNPWTWPSTVPCGGHGS